MKPILKRMTFPSKRDSANRRSGGGRLPACPRVAGFLLLCFFGSSPVPGHEENSVVIQQLTEQIKASPNDAMLYLKRAEMQRLIEHWHAAEPDYKRAAELDPKLTIVDLTFGTMWNDVGKPDKALPLLDRYLSREPASADGHAERARTKRMLKQWAAAAADYAAAVEQSAEPAPELFADWADTLCEGGDPMQALGILDRGLARLGQASSLEMKALDIEQANQRHAAALKRIDAMLDRPGRKDALLLRKAEILVAAEREDEARACVALARKEFNAVPEARRATVAGKELAARIERLDARLSPPAPAPNTTESSR